jgi:hypothetical protein
LEDLQAVPAALPDRSRARTEPHRRRPWQIEQRFGSGRVVVDATGEIVGVLDTPDLAAIVVACVNAQPDSATVVLDPRCSWCGRSAPPYVETRPLLTVTFCVCGKQARDGEPTCGKLPCIQALRDAEELAHHRAQRDGLAETGG